MAVQTLDRAQVTQVVAGTPEPAYEHEDTLRLVTLVKEAAALIRTKGEAAFRDFSMSGGRWREEDTYVFVLDRDGNMIVHPDPALEGKNTSELKDINGRPIIRGLIGAATLPGKTEGWYHYQWPVPGGLLPRWKSSYVELAKAPSGATYIVGSGVYNDRMEKSFVVDAVTAAVAEIEKSAEAAFPILRDPTGPYIAKDAYIFVIQSDGLELVNPAFPNLEGRNLLDMKDTDGTPIIRAMLDLVRARESGWIDYMWPKPGDSVSTRKSTYVKRAKLRDTWVLVGCGVYLAQAPKAAPNPAKLTARDLMRLVRDAAAVFEKHGEGAFADFREKGSEWFRDDTYFFVWAHDGTLVLHAAEPESEGRNDLGRKDILGRPFGAMIRDAAASPSGEGWIHYMYPEPGNIFPTWKSTFVKRVTFPSGRVHIIGSGVYNMQMDQAFVEDVVNRAADLVAQSGTQAFGQLRDKTGPFVFMDTYVFVETLNGTELVNPAQPSLEGRNLWDVRDLNGKPVIQDEVALALKDGRGWIDCCWYKPGDNRSARKQTYVRKVQSGPDTFIVGSGVYLE